MKGHKVWDIDAMLYNIHEYLQDIDKRLNELEQEEPEPQFSDKELLAIAELVADKYVYYLDELGNTDFNLNPSAQCIKEIHYKLIRYYAHDEVPEIKVDSNPMNLYCVILTPENVLGARSYLAVSAADEKEAKNKVVNWMLDNYEDWIIDPVKFRADVMQQKGLKILSFADSDVVPISLFKALY